MENFCHAVNNIADKFAYARQAFAFPPVFRDGAKSHANHMIEAAQNGLKLASREFVLRVRNDLLFKTDRIIDKYLDLYSNHYRRGEYTFVDMPIMISSLYTLNPFAGGRLPFHYGDWFHFGKTVEVRELWDVPPVDLAFMTYYLTNPSLPGTKEKERNFFSRLAIEQYVHFTYIAKKINGIHLTHQNDDRSVVQSIKILLDNFMIADVAGLDAYFPKYYDGFNSYGDNNTRIMEEDWIVLSGDRNIEVDRYLYKDIPDLRKYAPKRFPITIGAEHLHTNTGFKFGKSILVPHDAPNGIVCFGPYIGLFKGRYVARIEISALYPRDEDCYLTITAAHDGGRSGLNSIDVQTPYSEGYRNEKTFYEIEFELFEDKIDDFEIVITSHGYIDMSIDNIVLDKLG